MFMLHAPQYTGLRLTETDILQLLMDLLHSDRDTAALAGSSGQGASSKMVCLVMKESRQETSRKNKQLSISGEDTAEKVCGVSGKVRHV